MSAFESAIDDSFEYTPQPLPEDSNNDELLFDNAYNGPRDGHWDVTSSVESFVDDRCPTVYGYSANVRSTGHGMNIDGGLAKRLMQATIEGKRAAAAALPPPSKAASNVKAQSDAKAPKRFVVSPMRNKPHAPFTQQRQDGPKDAPKKTNSAHKVNEAIDMPKTQPAPARAPKATASKAASDTPRQGLPNTRVIRILGKNGEEAFIPVPSLPMMLSRPGGQGGGSVAPAVQGRCSAATPSKSETQPQKGVSNDGVRNTTVPAKSNVKIAEPQQTKKQKQKQKQKNQDATQQLNPGTAQSHRSGPAMMSGALPVPSEKASPAPLSAANSCKDSGIVIDDNLGVTSKPGSFKASSCKAGSANPGSAISQGVLNVAEKIAKMSSATSKHSRSARVEPAGWTFEETGMGVTTGFPAQQSASNRSATKPHTTSQQGSQQGSQRQVPSKGNSPRSQDQDSVHGTLRSNYQPPTVRSGSSSSSIVHSFGGMYQDGFVPQADASPFGSQHGSVGTQRSRSDRTKSDKAQSKLSKVYTASDAPRSDRTASP